jgi:pimeloyl-ACP methyl ester carboxylesterase
METKRLRMDDSTIAYIDKGEGQAIVLLHGFCGSSVYWEGVITLLAESYRVIAPDLPGHGQSTIPTEAYSIEACADTISDFLDGLNIQLVTMFGHSLGGYITLSFAEKYSERLNGFSLIHSTAFPDLEEAKKGRLANVEKIKESGIHPIIDGLVPKLFSPDNLGEKYVETVKEIGYSTAPEGAIRTLIAMKERPDLTSVLEATQLPVLLVAGDQDQIIPAEKTFSVSKATFKQALIDSGHMSMYESPDELIKEIKGFLSEI